MAWVEYTRLNPAPNSGGVVNALSGISRAILTCALLFHPTLFVMENVIALHWNQCFESAAAFQLPNLADWNLVKYEIPTKQVERALTIVGSLMIISSKPTRDLMP